MEPLLILHAAAALGAPWLVRRYGRGSLLLLAAAPAAGFIYTLLGPDGRPYQSATPGALGGNRAGRLYGRLDCPAAQRAIARGGYVKHRVFFADEATARQAGYRPCAVCLPEAYVEWKG